MPDGNCGRNATQALRGQLGGGLHNAGPYQANWQMKINRTSQANVTCPISLRIPSRLIPQAPLMTTSALPIIIDTSSRDDVKEKCRAQNTKKTVQSTSEQKKNKITPPAKRKDPTYPRPRGAHGSGSKGDQSCCECPLPCIPSHTRFIPRMKQPTSPNDIQDTLPHHRRQLPTDQDPTPPPSGTKDSGTDIVFSVPHGQE